MKNFIFLGLLLLFILVGIDAKKNQATRKTIYDFSGFKKMDCKNVNGKRKTLFLEILSVINYMKNYDQLSQMHTPDCQSSLDIYYNNEKKNTEKKPVVIFVHGGFWTFYHKDNYTDIGNFLNDNNYVTVIPQYITIPEGNIEDQINDVYKTIQWTYNNIEKYGGNKQQIILSGHSAGAHLILLTYLMASQNISNYLNNKSKLLIEFPIIKKMILLNGIYNINFIPIFILKRFFNIKFKINVSPIEILDKNIVNPLNIAGLDSVNIFYAQNNDFLLINSSSKKLIKLLNELDVNNKEYICKKQENENFIQNANDEEESLPINKECCHSVIIDGIKEKNPTIEKAFLHLIEN